MVAGAVATIVSMDAYLLSQILAYARGMPWQYSHVSSCLDWPFLLVVVLLIYQAQQVASVHQWNWHSIRRFSRFRLK